VRGRLTRRRTIRTGYCSKNWRTRSGKRDTVDVGRD